MKRKGKLDRSDGLMAGGLVLLFAGAYLVTPPLAVAMLGLLMFGAGWVSG